MIPILYDGNEQQFVNNGLGRLADAISCTVTEERNGEFELEMVYPITGVHYSDIAENRIILAKTEDGGTPQAFIIYKITKPLNGIVTINAEHISYLLNGIVVMPFSATSLASTMSNIANHAVVTCPFTFSTDISSSVHFSFETPRSIRALLGGESGSILDVYGGYDYKFNNFAVSLLANRGVDNGVTLRYGKNITELKNINDMTNVYTGIVPYWQSEHDTVFLNNPVVYSGHQNDYPYKIIKTVDFSSEFEEMPSQAQLLEKAQNYVASNKGWVLKNNITVSFVNLADTEDYKDIVALQRVKLCDTVHVVYQKLGVDVSTRVVKTVYNVLLDRYDSIELGETTTDLIKAINETVIEKGDIVRKGFMQAAIENATKLIQGGLGGHVVFKTNADGEPEEILIMDTDDINTAVNVIRMNLGGIAFSRNGYDPNEFVTAWTIDGSFYADFITAGTLNANRIKAGIIEDVAHNNYWNMETGDFKLSSGAKIGESTIASTANVSSAVDALDNSLDQTEVFNRLTNDSELQGIYMQNGTLYINGEYIKANTISANALTANAKQALQSKHDYIKNAFNDISLWEYGAVAPYYETIGGKKYLVLDGTGINSYNSSYYARMETDCIGDIDFTVHCVFHSDRTVAVAQQRFPRFDYYKDDGQSYTAYDNIPAQTLTANTSVTWDSTCNKSNVDTSSHPVKFGFYYIPKCKIYIETLEVTGLVDTYAESGLSFTANGLTSTVKKDNVISSINQTSEQVQISANKINLTGQLNLNGTFKTGNSETSGLTDYYAILTKSSLEFWKGTFKSADLKPVADGIHGGSGLTIMMYKPDGSTLSRAFSTYSFARCSSYQGTFDQLIVNGSDGGAPLTSTFYREVVFEGSDSTYVQFKGNVLNQSGGTEFVSDRRKKKDIKDLVIEKARSFIMGLRPRKYKFKKDISTSNRYHHGFIAQELKESMYDDWGVYCEDKEKDFIGLRYDEILADMVAVIQDQEKRIEALERKINDISIDKS